MTEVRSFSQPDGTRTAYRFAPGRGPTVVFLPGYMSDMAGSKASAVIAWAERKARACLLLDYSGCGQSEGAFADGTLSKWRDEVLALLAAEIPGPLVLIGSSMGGWLMLLLAEALQDKVVGVMGIAAAPDFTAWGYSPDKQARLAAGETVLEENPYGPDPTPTHAAFWQDGQSLRMLDRAIAIDCPVRLLHGQKDTDVPPEISLRLAATLRSGDVQVTLIKDGDHRLSREADIGLVLRTLEALLETAV